jgi:hypothetical protein
MPCVARCDDDDEVAPRTRTINANFICRAVNAHEALVEALKGLLVEQSHDCGPRVLCGTAPVDEAGAQLLCAVRSAA